MTEAEQIRKEYLEETLIPVCGHRNYESFKEWINESNWAVYEESNKSWINTRTRKVIGTQILYNKYLDARESENSYA